MVGEVWFGFILLRLDSWSYVIALLTSTRTYTVIAGDCACHDFTDAHGYGNCQKVHPSKNNLPVCYVNKPNNCPDSLENIETPGREISAYACKFNPDKYSYY